MFPGKGCLALGILQNTRMYKWRPDVHSQLHHGQVREQPTTIDHYVFDNFGGTWRHASKDHIEARDQGVGGQWEMQAGYHLCYNHVRKSYIAGTWSWRRVQLVFLGALEPPAQGGYATSTVFEIRHCRHSIAIFIQHAYNTTLQLIDGVRQWLIMHIRFCTLHICMEVRDCHKFICNPCALGLGLASSSPRQTLASSSTRQNLASR